MTNEELRAALLDLVERAGGAAGEVAGAALPPPAPEAREAGGEARQGAAQSAGQVLATAFSEVTKIVAQPALTPAAEATTAQAQAGSTPAADTAAPMPATGSLEERLAQLAGELGQLRAVSTIQADRVSENTQALSENTTAKESAATTAVKQAGNILSPVLKSGLGAVPLVSGLLKLFGGEKKAETPAPLEVYTPPAPLRVEAGISGPERTQVTAVDYSQDGRPRAIPVYSPQVTVQVQAMDSRSFLDHSEAIAQAVREAMLNSHPLNDVVAEL